MLLSKVSVVRLVPVSSVIHRSLCPCVPCQCWSMFCDCGWNLGCLVFSKVGLVIRSMPSHFGNGWSSAISLIQHFGDKRHLYSSLIMNIKQFLDKSWTVKVDHIYQEANWAANLSISMGHAFSFGLHIYYVPSGAFAVLFLKMLGVAFFWWENGAKAQTKTN